MLICPNDFGCGFVTCGLEIGVVAINEPIFYDKRRCKEIFPRY